VLVTIWDRWFSSGTPASSTTKTGRHDIAEILLKVALKHQKSKSKKSNQLKNYEIIHVDTNYSTLYIWAVVLLLSLAMEDSISIEPL
jgi:hypothetical protein